MLEESNPPADPKPSTEAAPDSAEKAASNPLTAADFPAGVMPSAPEPVTAFNANPLDFPNTATPDAIAAAKSDFERGVQAGERGEPPQPEASRAFQAGWRNGNPIFSNAPMVVHPCVLAPATDEEREKLYEILGDSEEERIRPVYGNYPPAPALNHSDIKALAAHEITRLRALCDSHRALTLADLLDNGFPKA